MRRFLSITFLISLLLSACAPSVPVTPSGSGSTVSSVPSGSPAGTTMTNPAAFGADVPYAEPSPAIASELATPFPLSDVRNADDILKAYGITLSAADRTLLDQRKFLMKRVPDTTIAPVLTDYEHGREFLGLYNALTNKDAKARTPANTIFWSADIFLHSYSLLETELLKEMENTSFAPGMKTLSETFYKASSEKLAAAKTEADRTTWTKVRNYFAVPYALLATSIAPLTKDSYVDASGIMRDPTQVKATFDAQDKAADTVESATAFIHKLKLDRTSETAVLSDLDAIFKASGTGVPAVFAPEYADYALKTKIQFKVDFSQFTPRSHYTSSSLRRQYFRAMNWYIQLPFFAASDALTTYAFAVAGLMAEHPDQMKSYGLLEATVNFLVGTSDDLMPADYLKALADTKGQPDQAAAIRKELLTMKPPKIKNLGAVYPSVGTVSSAEVLAATMGMRFFSGKFILDSYWTGFLTQGDEALRPGFTQKLPPMASSLEVMALLGSDYAAAKIPTLDFYKPTNAKAIDQAMGELKTETEAMTENDWRSNAYTTALWTMRGLFSFEKDHAKQLPPFMQSGDWAAKTLQTAAGFWTELRHTVLLYAKQSFAEKGAGNPCDTRTVPFPPKGYIEPQLVMYARLKYLAQRTHDGLQSLGFTQLQNFRPLDAYVNAMDQVIGYTQKELQNGTLTETVVEHNDPDADQPSGKCHWYEITQSDWEFLRYGLVNALDASLPIPVEGPVLPAKDVRSAVVADVHTDGIDQLVLYEGTGVPSVILVAVKDSNGPRLAIGFTYSQYEFTKPLEKRLTDEQWQENFYKPTDTSLPSGSYFDYTSPTTWPATNSWFAPLFGGG